MSEQAKQAILARRARFVAAALAAAGIGACETMRPQPCLSQVYVPPEAGPEAAIDDAGAATTAPNAPDATASTDATGALDSGSSRDAGADPIPRPSVDAAPPGPMPCLSVSPKPKPCLSQIPDDQ
jgi:hypothetical protein